MWAFTAHVVCDTGRIAAQTYAKHDTGEDLRCSWSRYADASVWP